MYDGAMETTTALSAFVPGFTTSSLIGLYWLRREGKKFLAVYLLTAVVFGGGTAAWLIDLTSAPKYATSCLTEAIYSVDRNVNLSELTTKTRNLRQNTIFETEKFCSMEREYGLDDPRTRDQQKLAIELQMRVLNKF